MLEKKESIIKEILADNEDFINIEKQLIEKLPKDESSDDFDDKNLDLSLKLQKIIIEVVYIEGLKDGVECQVEKKIKDNVGEWITLNQLHTLVPR